MSTCNKHRLDEIEAAGCAACAWQAFHHECERADKADAAFAREREEHGQCAYIVDEMRERAETAEAHVRELEALLEECQGSLADLTLVVARERERAETAEARVRELEALLVECHGCLVDSDYGEEPELRELLMRVGRALAAGKKEEGPLALELHASKLREEQLATALHDAEDRLALHDAAFAAVRDALSLPISFTYAEAREAVEQLKARVRELEARVRELEAVEAAFMKLLGILPALTAAADSGDCVEHHAALRMAENILLQEVEGQ